MMTPSPNFPAKSQKQNMTCRWVMLPARYPHSPASPPGALPQNVPFQQITSFHQRQQVSHDIRFHTQNLTLCSVRMQFSEMPCKQEPALTQAFPPWDASSADKSPQP